MTINIFSKRVGLIAITAIGLSQVCSMSAFAQPTNQTGNEASLAATIAFIVEKMSNYEGHNTLYPMMLHKTENIAVSPSRCVINFDSVTTSHDSSLHHIFHEVVDFSVARLGPPMIYDDGINGSTVSLGSGGLISVSNHELAIRVGKAAEHAAELCKGSRQEPF